MSQTRINPTRLLDKAGTIRPKLIGPNTARKALSQVLNQVKYGELNLTNSLGELRQYRGELPGPNAQATIHDERTWQVVAVQGSAGLGRSYMHGWWDSPDPVQVISFLNLNLRNLDNTRNKIAGLIAPVSKIKHSLTRSDKPRELDKDNIGSHYDIGNSFFELFLDETMTYSAGIFNNSTDSMKQASLNKYDHLIERTRITSDSHVLEIGAGWGGFAARVIEQTQCKVAATTISDEQFQAAQAKFKALNLDVDLRNSDWRDLNGSYDQLISIEMIEAVHWRDYQAFFDKISQCLKIGGTAGIQAICVPARNYERIKQTKDFIRTFIFPGGFLPSVDLIETHARRSGLETLEVFDMSSHYVKTLQLWRKEFDSKVQQLSELGLDSQFQRLWRFYLMYCESAFSQRSCTVNQIILRKQ